MAESMTTSKEDLKVSQLAENIIGSEIIKLAAEVNAKINNGEKVFNFTIGDYDPKLFPIPVALRDLIIDAYKRGETNYPSADGLLELREAVVNYLQRKLQISYQTDEVIISGGARPLIYGVYCTLVDKGDKVIYPVPSWNNNHYCYLLGATSIEVQTTPGNKFMPTVDDIRPHIKGATLLALCSPLNPTGTTFSKSQLEEICDMVLEENAQRAEGEKPLYVLYDQIYWELTLNDAKHYSPVELRPTMKKYTVYVDGISKSLAATGVRVGWALGPKKVMAKMKAILGHIGAWSPKAEQVATAAYLKQADNIDSFLTEMKGEVSKRLNSLYDGIVLLKKEGYPVDVIAPEGAIYLTVRFAMKGLMTRSGERLNNVADITTYLLNEAGLAIVPFSAFGTNRESDWYRLSVGTCNYQEIPNVLSKLKEALKGLKNG